MGRSGCSEVGWEDWESSLRLGVRGRAGVEGYTMRDSVTACCKSNNTRVPFPFSGHPHHPPTLRPPSKYFPSALPLLLSVWHHTGAILDVLTQTLY